MVDNKRVRDAGPLLGGLDNLGPVGDASGEQPAMWSPVDPRRRELLDVLHVAVRIVGASSGRIVDGAGVGEFASTDFASTDLASTDCVPAVRHELAHELRIALLHPTSGDRLGDMVLHDSDVPSDGDLVVLRLLASLAAGTIAGVDRYRELRRGRVLGLVVLDAQGRLRSASPDLAMAFGVDLDRSPDVAGLDLVHPDDLETAMAGLAKTTSFPGEKFPLDVRLRLGDGSWLPVEMTALSSENETIDGVVLQVRDVVDRTAVDMLVSHQSLVLSMIGRGEQLATSLGELARLVAQQVGGGCVITLRRRGESAVAGDDSSEVVAAFGVSEAFVEAVDATAVAADSTPWGTATFRAQSTRVDDLFAEPCGESMPAVFDERFGQQFGRRAARRMGQRVGCRVVQRPGTRGEALGARGDLGLSGRVSCWSVPVLGRSPSDAIGCISVFEPDGDTPRPDGVRVLGACASIAALAIERAAAEAILTYEANHDVLTGLANRNAFMQKLGEALDESDERGSSVAVMFIDLDRFKNINDALGHSAGDELLKLAADRLGSCVGDFGLVSRFGGDEFTVLCSRTSQPEMDRLASAVIAAFQTPFALGERAVLMTLSLGVAFAEGTPTAVGAIVTPEVMLQHADAALYAAKEAGRNRVCVFDETIAAQVVARLDIEHALASAIERREFSLHYQPEVDLNSERVVGVEAVMRWDHSERGAMSPAEFIPVAEETGAIVRLGEWALIEAIAQLSKWGGGSAAAGGASAEADDPFTMWVNISPVQLMQPGFVDFVAAAMVEGAVSPDRLGLEITETAFMADAQQALETIDALKRIGVRIAIDDFGTGYSSLAYLRQLKADIVKIDRSFVSDLDTPDGHNLVAAIVNMAHAVGCRTVAEGVETADQYRALKAMGCDMAQGFWLARPDVAQNRRPQLDRGAPQPVSR